MPKKIDPRNLVCHCTKGTSDKVYIASIRDNPDKTFTVLGKWGRNGKLNLMQMEQCTVETWYEAAREQQSLFNSKLAKDYVDINGNQYRGDLTYSTPCIRNNLENGIDNISVKTLAKNDNYIVGINKTTGKVVDVPRKRKTVQSTGIVENNEDVGNASGRRFDFDM